MKGYLDTLSRIFSAPSTFFQDMPKGPWQEDALSFGMITGWILSFTLTTVIFVNSYLPTGISLIDGIYGQKLLIALPVLAVMGLAFFAMTLLIVGGVLILAILGLFVTFGAMLNFLLTLLGGNGSLLDAIKAALYSSASVLVGTVNIVLLIALRYKLMSVSFWILLERVVFFAASLYVFYLFMIIGEKTHKCARWQSFLAATIPFVILFLVNMILSGKLLPKILGVLG